MEDKVILLGFYVGDEYFEKYSKSDALPQVAAFKLEGRFVDAICQTGTSVEAVSTVAISTFPRNKHIYCPRSRWRRGDVTGLVMPMINFPAIKFLTRFLSGVCGLLSKGKARLICVYSAHSPNLMAAYVYSIIWRRPYFVYVADLPSFMDMGLKRSSFLRLLKRFDGQLIDFLLSRSAGVFVASEYMIKDSKKWRDKPYLVLEGIASSESADKQNLSGKKRNIIFYAGGVNRAYGILELVEGFLKSGIDYELWICGRGDLEDYLKDTSNKYSSVKYLGFIPPVQVAEIQQEASLLVLTRDPAEAYTRYSFPSKLLEYMVSGAPILTTKLSGIPDEYFPHLNVISEFSVDGVCDSFREFSASDTRSLQDKAAVARDWVLQNKNSAAVGGKIVEFMELNK